MLGYRVWIKIHDAEVDYTAMGSPANSTIDIVVSAVNNGGESAVSEVITVKTR